MSHNNHDDDYDGICNEIEDDDEFWLMDPMVLLQNIQLIPNKDMSRNEYLNVFSRIVIIIAAVLWFNRDNRWWKVLFIGLGTSAAIWTTTRRNGFKDTSKYRRYISKLGTSMYKSTRNGIPDERLPKDEISPKGDSKSLSDRRVMSTRDLPRNNIEANTVDTVDILHKEDTSSLNKINTAKGTRIITTPITNIPPKVTYTYIHSNNGKQGRRPYTPEVTVVKDVSEMYTKRLAQDIHMQNDIRVNELRRADMESNLRG